MSTESQSLLYTTGRARAQSDTSLVESAVWLAAMAIHTRGEFPYVGKRAIRAARTLLRLQHRCNGWRKETGLESALEAIGCDPVSARVVDWEKFYAALESLPKKRRRKKTTVPPYGA